MNITLKDGSTREIIIGKMGAQQGWDMQRRFIEFAMSKDTTFRTEFTMQVLSFAKVKNGETELPLSTSAVIENHLGDWKNLEKVFNAVLIENDIDPEKHAEKEHYWAEAGGTMAAAFIEETVRLMGPLLQGKKKEE